MKLNRKNFAELFRNDFYTVGVVFSYSDGSIAKSHKVYTYKVPKDVVLDIGDKVVVCVSNDVEFARDLAVTQIVRLDKEPEIEEGGGFSYKWIVGRYCDIIADYQENMQKDISLKRAVSKLESALEKVSLRNQLMIAMRELGEVEMKELSDAFGFDLSQIKAISSDN